MQKNNLKYLRLLPAKLGGLAGMLALSVHYIFILIINL